MTEEKTFTLLSYHDKATADMVCAFLLKEFTYTSDGKVRVVEKEQKSGWEGRFCLVMDTYYKSFTTSSSRCQDAAGDFLKGVNVGKDESLARMERFYRSSLKSKNQRGSDDNPATVIKAIKWDDPVGKAAGIKCKRIGKNGYGELYIYNWDSDDKKGYWTRIFDSPDKALASDVNMPGLPEEFYS